MEKIENRGGTRKGAGRPIGTKKVNTKPLSCRIDEDLFDFFKEHLGKKWLIKKIEEEINK